jgi:tetratricopeptide (TPR) repeat protein
MTEKTKLSVFQILSRIFLALMSFICLLMSIFYLLVSFRSDKPMYAAMIIFLVLVLLFAPVYARLFMNMEQSYGQGVSKAAPFVRGGLFVLRLFAVFILAMFFITQSDRIKAEIYSTFNFSASIKEMNRLVELIRYDQRPELSGAIAEIQYQEKKIDFPLLIARNFESALEQAREDPNAAPEMSGTYALEQRLALDVFSTVDSIFRNIPDYEASKLSRYLPAQSLVSLLLEYGKFYLEYEKKPEADLYFHSAINVEPENNDVILSVGEIYQESDLLEEAAVYYERYTSLMKNDGKENHVPEKVTDFLNAGLYGENLHKGLYECWFHDLSEGIYCTEEYVRDYDIDHLYLGSQLYCPFIITPRFALFGPEYSWSALDSMNCGLAGCVTKLLGGEPVKMSVDAIEELCGISFYSDMDLPFTHINPEIIDWARKNMIPDPSTIFIDKPCRVIYNKLFRDVFRQKALAYTFLQSLYDGEVSSVDYQDRMFDEDFSAPGYLYEQFHGGADYSGRSDVDTWTLTLDTGFWLRRFIDGTADECWNLLSVIMNQYDTDWFDSVWEGWVSPEEGYGEFGGM